MRRLMGAGLAVAVSAVLLQASPAAAASTWPVKAVESVKIRKSPTTNSTALGLLPKGEQARAELYRNAVIKTYWGGEHGACGSKGTPFSDNWMKVTYKGTTGYVAWLCASAVR
ncbi:SH3 domain-containing protein [Streptomyces xiamenensis]|uniref:SH3 domain-containing protein n=1 Tax=Streptomyces xiamenensis TaxID=408015 RepID=UPI0035DCC4E5